MTSKVVDLIKPEILNGVGSFVLPCKRITLRFCNSGGSSRGMRQFLVKSLKDTARSTPKIEYVVVKQPGHPIVKGDYTNGRSKVICVRNLEPAKIAEKIKVLQTSSGAQLKKYSHAVESINPSIRGVWSPFHVEELYRHKI